MSKRGEIAAVTRNQPARRVKRAESTIERAAVEIFHQPARRLKRAASTTEPNVTRRDFAVANITANNRQGTYTKPLTHSLFLSYAHITQFIKFAVSKSTQTENDFSSLVASNAELVKDIIAKGQLMQQKDAKYIESLQERYLLCNRYQELKTKIAQQQDEIESLKNRIGSMEPAPAFVEDLIEFEDLIELINTSGIICIQIQYDNLCRIIFLPGSNENRSLEVAEVNVEDDFENWLNK